MSLPSVMEVGEIAKLKKKLLMGHFQGIFIARGKPWWKIQSTSNICTCFPFDFMEKKLSHSKSQLEYTYYYLHIYIT